VCNELYTAALSGNVRAANTLAAVLYRPQEAAAAAAKRGDERVPFYHQSEAEARGEYPDAVVAAAMYYFSGLKAWVSNVYGPYIFDQPDLDENGEPLADENASGPDFGWWGVLQGVAEAGVFGTLEQVYQTSIHAVCIFLVRKKEEAERMRSTLRSAAPAKSTDYD
jgi:hypothetical protein